MPVTRKKVFQGTADIIRRRVDEFDPKVHEPEVMETLVRLAIDFAMFFATDNSNFDAKRFTESCGFEADVSESINWTVGEAVRAREEGRNATRRGRS